MQDTLYISDLDGTLLNRNKRISDHSVKILNTLIKKELAFSIATARTPATVEELLAHLNIKEPIVVMNGAAIYDLKKQEYIKVTYLPDQLVEKIQQVIEKMNSSAFMYSIVKNDLTVYHKQLTNNYQIAFYEERKNKWNKTFKYAECNRKNNIVYFVFIDDKVNIQSVYEQIKKIKGLSFVKYKDIYSDAYYLEVYSEYATKANAIKYLKEKIKYQRVVCFGDHLNDISMFEQADACYAVGNAVPELKQIASGVIKSNEEDGVAEYLNKLVEEKKLS